LIVEPLFVSDDDAFLDSSHEKLGLIELRIGPVEEIDEDRTYSRGRCGVRKTQKSPILKLKVPDLTVHERVKKGVTQQITSVIFSIEEMHSTSADTGLGNPSLLTRMMRMGSIMCTLSPVAQTLSNFASNTVR
jgi:hypothetical protein